MKESSTFGSGHRQLSFHKRSVSRLLEFEGNLRAQYIRACISLWSTYDYNIGSLNLKFYVSIVQKGNFPFYVSGEYDAVIICVGAKVNMLPEISGRLPLRTCRGVILHMELPNNIG